MSCSVGIDIGTTSVKAVAVADDGTILDRVRLPHPVRVPAPDRFEHDADRAWRRGPRRAFARLAAHGPVGVAVASMVPSLTAVDRRGRPLTPGLLYGDGRGGGEEALGFLRWTAAQAPDAAGYWPAAAVATFALSGDAVVDFGTAWSSTPLVGATGWDADVLGTCGVGVEQLPRIEMMGAPAGKIRGSDAVLGAGGVDAMCEGMVADADHPGDVLVHCGTTLIAWAMVADEPKVDGAWTIPTMTPGVWSVGGPSNAGGLFLGWVDRVVGPARDEPDPGNVPVWSPYIRGERTPIADPDRRASLVGLNLTHGPGAIRRAAWEASAFVVRHHLDLSAVPVRRIVATGGGTRVAGWMQALADGTGLPVHVAAVPEGAALGAAWLARMAAGLESGYDGARAWAGTDRIVEPDGRWVGPTAERYCIFRELANLTLASGKGEA